MVDQATATDLERRKQIKIRLRKDLKIDPQKYEGRTFFVVKDPVSLRYYRLKEHEHYLLKFMDGKYTLQDAQKAYEDRFRPDRLRLEDLEAFAQQLLTAGLAQNEAPKSGKQLFERRRKKIRTEWMQKLTNILYIKLPVFDPEPLLNHMVKYFRWIFTFWWFMVSLGIMGAALLLVTTHFDVFMHKMPSYYEFFYSPKTLVYLWVALGMVKVIHEFGHGLSCKRFGGEVHEMGFLFLCFSPALYANVSDAWTLPNKWHRIIISAAGIYVELIIAALATFVWWNTSTSPLVNNLALCVMIVCSISTVVFNANPLMRFDGYYVLADWMEIPNLRERSNKFLKNLMLEHCLGMEVPPEPYMALHRRVLFIGYAILSYIYRWVVTFSILFFMYSFLKPYKLEVISAALTFASIASMVGWPAYRLGKGLYRRGRLPDMSRGRATVSLGVLALLFAFFFLVPVPVNRLRGTGLVVPRPETTDKMFVNFPGFLKSIKVVPGQYVNKGDELAVLVNEELESKLVAANAEVTSNASYYSVLLVLKDRAVEKSEKDRLENELNRAGKTRDLASIESDTLQKIKKTKLTLVAPRSGVIGRAPLAQDIGKLFHDDPSSPLITIHEPDSLSVCFPLAPSEFNQLKENMQLAGKADATGKIWEPDIILRVQGRDDKVWKGKIRQLPPSEAKDIPVALSNRAGGPVAVKSTESPNQLTPQTQQFLVYIEVLQPDGAILPGCMAQAKIYLKPETCATWLWRIISDLFNLSLI
ncbi:MAG: hypothetical protein EXR99_05430 [Gemmataceae bacterium]|nr:hypothetical protein [Gemmataceae bacterium]